MQIMARHGSDSHAAANLVALVLVLPSLLSCSYVVAPLTHTFLQAYTTSDCETESLQAEWLCNLLSEQISLPARATMMSDMWAQQR